MKIRLLFCMAFLCASITTLPGCGNTPAVVSTVEPLIPLAITSGMEFGTYQGLTALAKNNPAAAETTATALKKAIDTVLTPYFNGDKIGTSAEIHDLLNSSLFTGVDPLVREAIATAAAIAFDTYVPLPGAATVLTPTQIAYFKAFLAGISKGCDDFHGKAIPQQHWIDSK